MRVFFNMIQLVGSHVPSASHSVCYG